jgi:arginine/lysine/ornithine decarboxylase
VENLDITEISGADNLYDPSGIILQSEQNATALFGSYHTYFSTEGSTHCIKTMLAAVCEGESGKILAGRNAHKAFIYGAAALDLGVDWVYGESGHLCAANITARDIETHLKAQNYTAVYLTSPDYLGNILPIAEISAVCKKYKVPLLVDNAHGAYLKFLKPSMHPIDLGADMCCDSAHKTLPVLTGGAYLHIKSEKYAHKIRKYLAFFGSTSPSYLTMASLDLCNKYLAENMCENLENALKRVEEIKALAIKSGFKVLHTEPMKTCINLADSGYKKSEFLFLLSCAGIEIEFCDETFAVFMLSPQNTPEDFEKLKNFFAKTRGKKALASSLPPIIKGEKAKSIREALTGDSERISSLAAAGRICASPLCSCPPAVPVVISGEVITEAHVTALLRYGFEEIDVLK